MRSPLPLGLEIRPRGGSSCGSAPSCRVKFSMERVYYYIQNTTTYVRASCMVHTSMQEGRKACYRSEFELHAEYLYFNGRETVCKEASCYVGHRTSIYAYERAL